MTGLEVAFTLTALVGLVTAVRMVTARNLVHGVLFMVVTLAAVGAAYLLLAAEFLAWVQILIYVGAIVILFLFGLMLTKAPIGRQAMHNRQRGPAALVGLVVMAGLAVLILGAFGWSGARVDTDQTTAGAVGAAIFRSFVLPFEAVSFVLLAALIGAIVLARRDESR